MKNPKNEKFFNPLEAANYLKSHITKNHFFRIKRASSSHLWREGKYANIEPRQKMRDNFTEQCKNCRNAFRALGLNQPILICSKKAGCEGNCYVVLSGDYCRNFQTKRKISRRNKPPLPESDDVRFIPLTQGKFAVVDAEDYDRLAKYKWSTSREQHLFYACRCNNYKRVLMHREILNATKEKVVDHIDGNGLNNRRNNLRLCTKAQNNLNSRPRRSSTSKYKGVCYDRKLNKWLSQIIWRGERTYLGRFKDETEAAIAYDRKAEQLFGEFAYLNFPQLAEFRKWARKIIFAA